jgi:hypothetical protein
MVGLKEKPTVCQTGIQIQCWFSKSKKVMFSKRARGWGIVITACVQRKSLLLGTGEG